MSFAHVLWGMGEETEREQTGKYRGQGLLCLLFTFGPEISWFPSGSPATPRSLLLQISNVNRAPLARPPDTLLSAWDPAQPDKEESSPLGTSILFFPSSCHPTPTLSGLRYYVHHRGLFPGSLVLACHFHCHPCLAYRPQGHAASCS